MPHFWRKLEQFISVIPNHYLETLRDWRNPYFSSIFPSGFFQISDCFNDEIKKNENEKVNLGLESNKDEIKSFIQPANRNNLASKQTCSVCLIFLFFFFHGGLYGFSLEKYWDACGFVYTYLRKFNRCFQLFQSFPFCLFLDF